MVQPSTRAKGTFNAMREGYLGPGMAGAYPPQPPADPEGADEGVGGVQAMEGSKKSTKNKSDE